MSSFKVGDAYRPNAPFVPPIKPSQRATTKSIQGQSLFDQHLQRVREQSALKFSQHALDRLEERNIFLSAEHLSKLNGALAKARAKGAQDSMFLLENMAMIVSVKNDTVITVLEKQNMEEHIITNIDSAVLL